MPFKGDFRFLAAITLIPVLATLSFDFAPNSRSIFKMALPPSPEASKQIEYAQQYFAEPNVEEYGYLGNVDCANFVSQTLIARGWAMDEEWWQDPEAWEGYGYSRAWVSSTALNAYLMARPVLARPMAWGQRDVVNVGDLVMFDWDASGDRDHTAVVSAIRLGQRGREILLTAHSEGMFDYPLSQELRYNPDNTKVYFWRILSQQKGIASFRPKPLEAFTAESLKPIDQSTLPHWMER